VGTDLEKTAVEQLWYYRRLLAFFEERRPGPLTDDLRQAVEELGALVTLDDAVRGRSTGRFRISSRRQTSCGDGLGVG